MKTELPPFLDSLPRMIIEFFVAAVLSLGVWAIYFVEPSTDQKLPALWNFLQLSFTLGALVIALGGMSKSNEDMRYMKRVGASFVLSGILFIFGVGLSSLGNHTAGEFVKTVYYWACWIVYGISFIIFSFSLLELMRETIRSRREK